MICMTNVVRLFGTTVSMVDWSHVSIMKIAGREEFYFGESLQLVLGINCPKAINVGGGGTTGMSLYSNW